MNDDFDALKLKELMGEWVFRPIDCPICGQPFVWGQHLYHVHEVGMCTNGHLSPRVRFKRKPEKPKVDPVIFRRCV